MIARLVLRAVKIARFVLRALHDRRFRAHSAVSAALIARKRRS